MMIALWVAVLVGSLWGISKSASTFVDNTVKLGRVWGWPSFLLGIVVVSLGTSLPELGTGLSSVWRGESEMFLANMLGSNVANVLLGLGLVIFLARRSLVFREPIYNLHFPVFVIAMGAIWFLLQDQVINRWEGGLLIAMASAYIWYLLSSEKKAPPTKRIPFSWRYFLGVVVGIIGLVISAEGTIRSIIFLAESLGFGKTSLSATVVAIGTSLPEMMVVYMALKQKQSEVAIGNIIGSNIFNVTLLVGIGALVQPLSSSAQINDLILPFAILAMMVCWVVTKTSRISPAEGAVMTLLYGVFLAKLFHWF